MWKRVWFQNVPGEWQFMDFLAEKSDAQANRFRKAGCIEVLVTADDETPAGVTLDEFGLVQ